MLLSLSWVLLFSSQMGWPVRVFKGHWRLFAKKLKGAFIFMSKYFMWTLDFFHTLYSTKLPIRASQPQQPQSSSIYNIKPLRLEKWIMSQTASAVQTPATQTHKPEDKNHIIYLLHSWQKNKWKPNTMPAQTPLHCFGLWARCNRELTHQTVENWATECSEI